MIRFSEVYRILSPFFRLTKAETWDLLVEMERFGLIRIIRHNGIKITEEMEGGMNG
ncbi:MAG: hypothetical protein SCAL_000569 [Candidatus Syntrophoarchaeum caldarius]|uniref:Uncharacterized protein n=1 Tax=Candidatus Syntropharchaeum caldarium TaxID=1838285 RepID=A0A1F2P975_9EURY|nr:MAG: hypothetical protein SCAL_000569 [Candidatus Syntrophoarchaeum caldarius]